MLRGTKIKLENMGKLIEWVEFDEPKKYKDAVTGKELEMKGEFVCHDERVKKFWFYGGGSVHPENREIISYASFLFKDGTRHETRIDDTKGLDHSITQAENYLITIV